MCYSHWSFHQILTFSTCCVLWIPALYLFSQTGVWTREYAILFFSWTAVRAPQLTYHCFAHEQTDIFIYSVIAYTHFISFVTIHLQILFYVFRIFFFWFSLRFTIFRQQMGNRELEKNFHEFIRNNVASHSNISAFRWKDTTEEN